MNNTLERGSYPVTATDIRTKEAFGCEQHHLRVIGDRAESAIGRCIVDYALRAGGGANGAPFAKFDGGTQRVTHCTAKQTAFDPVNSVHVRVLTRPGSMLAADPAFS